MRLWTPCDISRSGYLLVAMMLLALLAVPASAYITCDQGTTVVTADSEIILSGTARDPVPLVPTEVSIDGFEVSNVYVYEGGDYYQTVWTTAAPVQLSVGDNYITVYTDAHQLTVQVTRLASAPFTEVTLSADPPSPTPYRVPITLTAGTDGGTDVEYQFLRSVPGGTPRILRDFDSEAIMIWNTEGWQLGSVNLTVVARDATGYSMTSPALPYWVYPPLLSITLMVKTPSPTYVGQAVKLDTSQVAGYDVHYKFMAGSVVLRDFSRQDHITWYPTCPGTRMLTVTGRDASGLTLTSSAVSYKVDSPLMSASLSPSLASPQILGATIRLTANAAVAVGTLNLQYKFMAGPVVLRDYSSNSTYDWTPAAAGDTKLVVIAKDQWGKTVTSPSMNYSIVSPVSSAALEASLGSPQVVGTPIRLTATAVGGTGLQYKFVYGAGGVLRDFGTRNWVDWMPASVAVRSLRVVVRDAAANEVASPAVPYTIYNPASAVALSADPASPQPVGSAITLRAVPTGGSGLVYRFLSGGGILRDFSATNWITWKPTTAGSRSLTVVAKDGAGNTVVSPAVSYTVTAGP